MLAAVADFTVDAMVDDDVVLVPLGDDPRYDVAFTVRHPQPVGDRGRQGQPCPAWASSTPRSRPS